jgi:hypothetical protein
MCSGALLAWAGAAHAVTGSGALDAPAESADLLRVICFDDGSGAPASLTALITDLPPSAAPFVSVQLWKADGPPDARGTSATDAVDADAVPGPLVFVDGGAGEYLVFVDKTAAGEELYEFTLQCTTGSGGSGAPTGTLVPALVPEVPVGGPFAHLLALLALLAAARSRLSARARAWQKGLLVASATALCAGASMPASAHTQNGSLGSGASATDAYQVTCLPGSQSLAVQILDSSPGALPLVSARVQRGEQLVSTSDTIAADAVRSPEVVLNLGPGAHLVLIDKTGAGAKFYSLSYHCYSLPDGNGAETSSSISTLQSQ